MSMLAHAVSDQESDGEDSGGGGIGDIGVEDYVTSAAPSPAPNEIAHLGVPMPPERFISWLKYDDHGLLPAEDICFFRSKNDNLVDKDQDNSNMNPPTTAMKKTRIILNVAPFLFQEVS
jgi:hypothetical protein